MIRWGYMYRSAHHFLSLMLLQSCSEIEFSKVEECTYLKTAVVCRGNAWECHAQLCEALDDEAILY